MRQEIRVLQCTECKMFQVDLVKKVKTWACKVCNVKQRSMTEFFRGSGPECRVLVQKLNKNKELTALSTFTFTSPNHMVLPSVQHTLPSEYKKLKENGFTSNESESNDKDFSVRNVDNHQNNNIESSLENTKELAEIERQNSNKRPSNDSYKSMKKTSKWDKYV